jgi:hypothetical protein
VSAPSAGPEPGTPTARRPSGSGDPGRSQAPLLVEYGIIAVIAIVVAVLALAVFDEQVTFVLSVIGSEIDRAT